MDATQIEKDQTRIQPGQKWAERDGDNLYSVYDYDAFRELVFCLNTRKPDDHWCQEEAEFRANHELVPEEDAQ